MGKVILFVVFFLVLGNLLFSKYQIQPLRNKIIFEDKVEKVADSLERMHSLLEKFPITRRVNYFMDREGNLFISNENIGPLKGAINNPRTRNDIAFEKFTDKEINEFFELMSFLYGNHIDAATLQKPIGKFLFKYRRTEENKYNDLREVMIIKSPKDTLLKEFKKSYKILDKKTNLILVAPKDAEVW